MKIRYKNNTLKGTRTRTAYLSASDSADTTGHKKYAKTWQQGKIVLVSQMDTPLRSLRGKRIRTLRDVGYWHVGYPIGPWSPHNEPMVGSEVGSDEKELC